MGTNSLKELLNELTLFWHKNNTPILEILAPGVDIREKEIQQFTGTLPNELVELYKWRNGIGDTPGDQPIGSLSLFELGIFMPFERMLFIQEEMVDGSEFGWGSTKLPLFESGGGEYFLIECDDSINSYGQIFYHSIGAVEFNKVISIYDSLYTLFLGIFENNKKGIFRYEGEKGLFRVDGNRSFEMGKKLNPNSEYWKLE